MTRTRGAFLIATFLIGGRLWAQSTAAEIVGTVESQDYAPLPGVLLTITHQSSGQQRSVTADRGGNFVAASLPLGAYTIKAELPNFKTQIRDGVVLRVAERVRVDLVLEIGELREQITVTDSAPLLRTTNAEVGEVIANQRIITLPLNGRRFSDLLLLSDNLVAEPRGTRGAALGQTGPTVAVAGQRGGHNLYFLDGVSVTDQYFNNLTVSPAIDSIQEFNIQKSIYAAEYGGKAAAVINAATKSGGNSVHGSAYEFFRNSALDARNFFNGVVKPPLRQNQFGGTLGGPIKKDQTFFFLSGEALRERRALTRTFSLPDAQVRSGDFSGRPVIYDPLSTDLLTGRRVPFAGNRIPLARLDPVARAFLEKIPLPNLASAVQNFVAASRSTNDNIQATGRLDHRLSPKDSLYARFTFSDSGTFRPFGSTDLNETLVPGFGTRISTVTRNFAINHTHVFSPTLVHDLRFGYLSATGGQELENQGADFALRGVTRDPQKMGFPAFNFADAYSSMGDPATFVSRRNTNFDLFSNLSWNRGAHTVKVGAYLFRLRFRPQDSPNARGAFSFTPRFSSSAAGLADGNAFADFLLGYPSVAQVGIGRGEEDGRTTWLHVYAQDDWKATRNLTINVGLRSEINGHITDTQNRLSNIEVGRFVVASDDSGNIHPDAQALLPLIPVPVVTSKDAGYDRSLLRPSYRRFAPRVGLAWTPGGSKRTVIRAGFGLFFNQWAYSVQTALMQNLPFYFNKSVTVAADTPIPTLSTRDILEAPNTGSIGGSGMDQNYRGEYAESWTFSVQQMLSSSLVAEASYFGSKVIGADDTTWANIPEPGPGPVAARRPNPQLSGFRIIHWGGYSNYHSLSLKLERRLSRGLLANANYTWSKATDVASSPGPTFSETNFPQNVRNRRAENALSSFDHRHRLAFSFVYDLPVGPGHFWNPAGLLGKIFAGWSITGIGTFQTGAPFTVNIPSDNANIGPGPSQRPDVNRDPNLGMKIPERWFDTGAFQMPRAFTFGNAGRNIVFADGLTNMDASLMKRAGIHDKATLEFRTEFFNLLNNTNFADAPGRIAFTPSFGRYFTAENPRQIQLAVKLIF